MYELWHHRLQYFLKYPLFYLFPYKSIRDQIWYCRKIVQGQPRVIIWTNLVVFEHPMLTTKFKVIYLLVPEKKIFFRFLPYMGMATILVMWPDRLHKLSPPPTPSPVPRRLHLKFGFNRPIGFWAEDVWKCWHTHTNIWTTEAYLRLSLKAQVS